MERKMPSISLRPIDVGFDLRLHKDMVAAVPADTTEVRYAYRDDHDRIVTGDLDAIVRKLRAAGYRVQVTASGG
ncbi:MAG: hypothetical protein GEU91_18380 [Rhizobiales bacterium]|nr:hypothetical protein [Hyphomicrobiales bacterium]